MIKIKVYKNEYTYLYEHTFFIKNNKPKCLTHNCYYSFNLNKLERLLFIRGLEYTNERYKHIFDHTKITMYTLKDFQKYIEILHIYKPEHKFTYDKKKVELFYD